MAVLLAVNGRGIRRAGRRARGGETGTANRVRGVDRPGHGVIRHRGVHPPAVGPVGVGAVDRAEGRPGVDDGVLRGAGDVDVPGPVVGAVLAPTAQPAALEDGLARLLREQAAAVHMQE